MAAPPTQPDWYRQQRQALESMVADAFPAPDDSPIVSTSPAGRYRLEIVALANADGRLRVTRGRVTDNASDVEIACVDRNFVHFPFTWVEDHPGGHDYLICGEDYQGQTVIELDTGRRTDFVPEAAQSGFGFCWTAHYPSPDRRFLFVDGCIWGAPYELIQFEFDDPLSLPYREVKRWPGAGTCGGIDTVHGFDEQGRLQFDGYVEYRATDGRGVDEMTAEEWDTWSDSPTYEAESREGKLKVLWRPDGTEQVERSWREA